MSEQLPFSAPTRAWFEDQFGRPTAVQAAGWPVIASGAHSLLIAPTGSGKTLAAFLWGLDRLATEPRPEAGVRIVYVSPLKALVYDIERNLRAPLAGIRRYRRDHALAPLEVEVDVRTGDTPARERQRQARKPAPVLVTTPESLYLILGARARSTLASVEAVIVDEIHVMAGTKRGAHLALSLERLSELCSSDPQRIGLTATVRPAQTAAAFLGGDRPVQVVDAGLAPSLALQVSVPVPAMEQVPAEPRPGGPVLGELAARQAGTGSGERGIWPAIYPRLLERIQANRTTLIFVNSRGLCERLAHRLNELAGAEWVFAHHGSVSHQRRAELEDRLKRGAIRGLVATSSLELGIDMGSIDEVLLVESPGSVARGLQRVGRAGHGVGEVSRGCIFPKFRGDLLESAVIARRMLGGEIESLAPVENALDVLAQQVAALCCDRPRSPAEIATLVRRAGPYRRLGDDSLQSVLQMLSGDFPSSEFADLRPLLNWDRRADRLTPRRGTPMLVRLNAGTIPDRGLYAVHLGEDGPRIGELDEEMVYETRVGENVLLGASSWHVERITRDRVIVTPAPGEPGRLPFWHGDGPGRPIELGRALGAFVRELGSLPAHRGQDWLARHTPLDSLARRNLVDYLAEQRAATGSLPTDRAITVERFRDELGDWRVCILSPFGARVHAPWALALQRELGRRSGFEVQALYSDDGLVLRFADTDQAPGVDELLPEPDELEALVTEQLADSALFAGLFRENAARALLMPRRRHDGRQPLWAQRLKAQGLLAAVRRYPRFPIVLETYRQCLADVFDLPALRQLLSELHQRQLRIDEVETEQASPFARSLVFEYVAAYLYEGDAPLAERRAQALTLDRGLLAELLGQAELRELLDPGALDDLTAHLQCLAKDRQAADADALHDLLRRLGDLSRAELQQRCRGDVDAWLVELAAQKRVARIRLGGEQRWIAAVDAGLYRDALGSVPPPGLPADCLAPREDAVEQLVQRYARCHGPFTGAELAARYAAPPAQMAPALSLLGSDGRLVQGDIRPGGSELEWCDPDVLRRLRRLSLARSRAAAAPVDARLLGRFLPAWQGLEQPGRGAEGLLEAIDRLQGMALPWSSLVYQVLPARLQDFDLDTLDTLAASGEVVWIGEGALGPRDGRVRLLLRAQHDGSALAPNPPPADATPEQDDLLELLRQRGASFRVDLEQAWRAHRPEADARAFEACLWDLVWQGRISNDTFAPLRALLAGVRAGGRSRGRRRAGLAGGRWFLTGELGPATTEPTRQALALCHRLLQRYGVVSREAAQAESAAGGFATLYPVLRGMAEAGRVQRGYFVEGLSGAQFALPGAVDRLRGFDQPTPGPAEVRVLAAVDPANPYGALLPWPTVAQTRARRVSGALVALIDGLPVVFAGPGWRQLVIFETEPDRLEPALRALARFPRGGDRRRRVERINGQPAPESELRPLLLRCGFVAEPNGFSLLPQFAVDRGHPHA